ncbi:MAG: hypothetical protein CMD16_02940 [Flavobacteriales bacterium]|nr:hypothetical protein [Flavobacteriales bacterium]|tara:strand:- start:2106 stop:2543 length:438 start_codon:yes stop_codon:yes gene_type:complete
MNLEGIINIAGKSGLYKVISQAKNSVIVESLTDHKRLPLYSNNQANMLEEIGIYTYDDTKPLSGIFNDIAKKENCKETISHKSSKNELESYFREVLPDYDEERVYISDIKKVIQWYNTMQKHGLIKLQKKEKNKNTITETKNENK